MFFQITIFVWIYKSSHVNLRCAQKWNDKCAFNNVLNLQNVFLSCTIFFKLTLIIIIINNNNERQRKPRKETTLNPSLHLGSPKLRTLFFSFVFFLVYTNWISLQNDVWLSLQMRTYSSRESKLNRTLVEENCVSGRNAAYEMLPDGNWVIF